MSREEYNSLNENDIIRCGDEEWLVVEKTLNGIEWYNMCEGTHWFEKIED